MPRLENSNEHALYSGSEQSGDLTLCQPPVHRQRPLAASQTPPCSQVSCWHAAELKRRRERAIENSSARTRIVLALLAVVAELALAGARLGLAGTVQTAVDADAPRCAKRAEKMRVERAQRARAVRVGGVLHAVPV